MVLAMFSQMHSLCMYPLVLHADSRPPTQALPEAAMVLATPDAARANAPHLAALATWAPAGAVEGLQLMAGAAQLHAGVKAYAIRCLHATPPAKVAFFLPQLVQVGVRGGAGVGGVGTGTGVCRARGVTRLGPGCVGGSAQPPGHGKDAAGRTSGRCSLCTLMRCGLILMPRLVHMGEGE